MHVKYELIYLHTSRSDSSQVVVRVRKICQEKTNWKLLLSLDRLDKLSTLQMTLHVLFFFSLQSIVNSYCLIFFCLSAVGICGCQGDRQKTGRHRETQQQRIMGMRGAALFHMDDHPSQPPSVAWQLQNVICVAAGLNSAYVHISVCVCWCWWRQ